MPAGRRIAVVLVAASLSAPASAAGQTTTIPQDGADVSPQPPVQLSDARPTASAELPNTGSDPRLLFLTGIALTLVGVGLRLRTADADLY